jgi:hypothetical protein
MDAFSAGAGFTAEDFARVLATIFTIGMILWLAWQVKGSYHIIREEDDGFFKGTFNIILSLSVVLTLMVVLL